VQCLLEPVPVTAIDSRESTGGVALLGGVLLALAAGEALHHQPSSVAYVALGQLSHLAGSDGCSSSPRSRAGLYRVTFQAPYGTLACAG
jgi:hypothetical protein